jgi:membrane-bound serine protease (ClpP class)
MAVNDAVAYIRGVADLHGRNALWAVRAVREAATLPAREALEHNVIEIVAPDLDGVLSAAHGRTVRFPDGSTRQLATRNLVVERIDPDWRVQLLAVITNPNVAYILLLVGIYGILFEFMSPGTVFSGVIGAICLLIALFALNLLPINYAGIGLMLLGIALMVAEVFSPSFGILGIGGVTALALGSLFLFDTDIPGFTLSLPVVVTATLASAAFVLIGGGAAIRSHRRRVVTGDVALLGSPASVLEWSAGEGQVLVHGERWHANGPAHLSVGQRVRITGRKGLSLLVAAETATESAPRSGELDAD